MQYFIIFVAIVLLLQVYLYVTYNNLLKNYTELNNEYVQLNQRYDVRLNNLLELHQDFTDLSEQHFALLKVLQPYRKSIGDALDVFYPEASDGTKTLSN